MIPGLWPLNEPRRWPYPNRTLTAQPDPGMIPGLWPLNKPHRWPYPKRGPTAQPDPGMIPGLWPLNKPRRWPFPKRTRSAGHDFRPGAFTPRHHPTSPPPPPAGSPHQPQHGAGGTSPYPHYVSAPWTLRPIVPLGSDKRTGLSWSRLYPGTHFAAAWREGARSGL